MIINIITKSRINAFSVRSLCLVGLFLVWGASCGVAQNESLVCAVSEGSSLPSPLWIPLPGTSLEENVEAVRLRSGAVRLLWWVAAPGKVETVIRRREQVSEGEWVELGRVHDVDYVDRTVLPNRVYEYELETVGALEDGGGQTAYAEVVVGEVVPPLPPKYFAVVDFKGQRHAEWLLFPDSPADSLKIEEKDESGDVLLTELTPNTTAYIWDHVPESRLAYVLETGSVQADIALPPSSEVEVTGGFPSLSNLSLQPHPRLFISEEGIEQYKQWAKEDKRMAKALREVEAEAEDAYRTMLKKKGKIEHKRDTVGHRDNIRMIRQMALGWAFTGREEWRKCAEDVMLEYATFYKDIRIVRKYADGYLSSQTLNEAMTMITFAWAYDLLYSTLDEETKQTIEKGVLIPAYEIIARNVRYASNWQSYHNAAMIAIALAMGNLEYLEHAVNGPSGVVWQMRNTLGMDGIYYAQSLAYHYFVMSAFTATAAMLYENGIDLFAYRDGGRNLRNMYEVSFYHAMSNGNQAPFGDSQTTYGIDAQWIAWNYAYAYRHYREPSYLWQWEVSGGQQRRNDNRVPVLLAFGQIYQAELENAEEDIPTVAEPKVIGTGPTFSPAIRNVVGSSILEDVGMVVLRGTPEAASGESAMIWKPHGKTAGHQHPNSLGIYWQSPGGHRWISGSGKWVSYSDELHKGWVMQTLSDNTLIVDRESHQPMYPGAPSWSKDEEGKPTQGYLLGFTAGPDFGYVSGFNNRVYEHASIARRHINAGVYALDIMRGESNREALFDYALHFWGELEASNVKLHPAPEPLSDTHGYPYLKGRLQGASDGVWQARWKSATSEERLYLDVLGETGSVYHVSRTPWTGDRIRSSILVSREGSEADFIALWRASDGNDPVMEIVPLGEREPGALEGGLKVKLRDGVEDLHVWGPGMSDVSWGDVSFRARDAMLRFQGTDLKGATVVEGDRLEITGELSLALTLPGNWSLRRLDGGGFVLVYDDDYPITVTVDSNTGYEAWELDAWGDPVGTISPKGDKQWSLSPRRNLLFLPAGSQVASLPALTKTVQLASADGDEQSED